MYEIKTNGQRVKETGSEKVAYAILAEECSKPMARTVEMNSITTDGTTGWLVRTPIHKITR